MAPWGIIAVLGTAPAAAAPLDPFLFAPLAPELVSTGPITVDTGELTLVADGTTFRGENHDGVAVFTFGEVRIRHDVDVYGARPFALLAHGDVILRGVVEASARSPDLPGPGGFLGGNSGSGSGPGGGSGTVGGAGGGGFGGGGGAADSGIPGGARNGDLLEALIGGSGGGSAWDLLPPRGGSGGGAVEIGAGGQISIDGTIRADGGHGEDAAGVHGGGGGAGGAILVHAGAGGQCSGLLSAAGGHGGAGAVDLLGLIEYGDGGGGGGGRITLVGIDPTGCDLWVRGGDGFASGDAEAEDGEAGAVLVVDPDGDGDGHTMLDGDCDDADPAVHPARAEDPCNGTDDDCDPATPDAPDADGDGHPVCDDCDDGNPAASDPSDAGCGEGPDGPAGAGDTATAIRAAPEPAVLPAPWFCAQGPSGGGLGAGAVVALLAARRCRRRPRSPASSRPT